MARIESYPSPVFSNTSRQIKSILFPTDFSETARQAFTYTLRLAEDLGASIVLLHVYQETPVDIAYMPMEFMDALKAEKMEKAHEAFQAYLKDFRSRTVEEGRINTLLQSGRPANEILRYSEELQVDLIAMGTQGAASPSEKILGSVTAEVIERAHCPVLAIPRETNYQPVKQILYGLGGEEAEIAVVDKLMALAEGFQAKLICTHIQAQDEEVDQVQQHPAWEALKSIEEGGNLELVMMENEDEIFRGLQKFITRHRVDLLAMMTHQPGKTESYKKRQSLTRKMMLYTDIPLLAFHAPSTR
ncbi:MAG: universal stress protein [Bacteroidota bacterium]